MASCQEALRKLVDVVLHSSHVREEEVRYHAKERGKRTRVRNDYTDLPYVVPHCLDCKCTSVYSTGTGYPLVGK